MGNSIYIFDACSFIEASKRYHINKKNFQFIWDKFKQMFESGQLISSIEIFDELKDEDLQEWMKEYKKCFRPLSKSIQDKVTTILQDYPDIINVKKSRKSSSNGDPFLIATAMCEDGQVIVITEENKNREFGIPKICSNYNIECKNLDEFLQDVLE